MADTPKRNKDDDRRLIIGLAVFQCAAAAAGLFAHSHEAVAWLILVLFVVVDVILLRVVLRATLPSVAKSLAAAALLAGLLGGLVFAAWLARSPAERSVPSPTTAPPPVETTSTTTTTVEATPVFLKDLPATGTGLAPGSWPIGPGSRYVNSLAAEKVGCRPDRDSATYQLDGNYSRLQAEIGVTPDTNPVVQMTFIVVADGVSSSFDTSVEEPGSIDIDITGVSTLVLKLEAKDDMDDCIVGGRAVWGNARIFPMGSD